MPRGTRSLFQLQRDGCWGFAGATLLCSLLIFTLKRYKGFTKRVRCNCAAAARRKLCYLRWTAARTEDVHIDDLCEVADKWRFLLD